MLFQVVRGGIESVWVFGRSRGPITPGILTLDPSVPSIPTTSRANPIALPANRRNGYVVQFSFFGSKLSPFFQIRSATAEIFRASVNRAISLRIPFFSNP